MKREEYEDNDDDDGDLMITMMCSVTICFLRFRRK